MYVLLLVGGTEHAIGNMDLPQLVQLYKSNVIGLAQDWWTWYLLLTYIYTG